MRWNIAYYESEDGLAIIKKQSSTDRRRTISTWALSIREPRLEEYRYIGIDDNTLSEAQERYDRWLRR